MDNVNHPKHYDATDALAVALCHWHQINRPVISTGKGLTLISRQ